MTTNKETVMNIALEKLVPFRDHPFQVQDDEQMQMITESIRSVGVLVPAIVRPLEDRSFELISDHRRKHACEIAGLSTLPVIVRDVDQDTATVMMVDSNFQRIFNTTRSSVWGLDISTPGRLLLARRLRLSS